jgi:hypothetical protein
MEQDLIEVVKRVGFTIGGISSELDNQTDSLCERLNRIGDNLGYIDSAVANLNSLPNIEYHLLGIENALERIASALERKNN